MLKISYLRVKVGLLNEAMRAAISLASATSLNRNDSLEMILTEIYFIAL